MFDPSKNELFKSGLVIVVKFQILKEPPLNPHTTKKLLLSIFKPLIDILEYETKLDSKLIELTSSNLTSPHNVPTAIIESFTKPNALIAHVSL